jgi:ADP-ribose pyrophosphatase YjhB (NUDIX family)
VTDRNSHCSFCGSAFAAGQDWPRTCAGCGQISYVNPLPVAVTLLPVDRGLLVVRRSIEPQSGKLALPGGFIDVGETWQQAAARELFEETGIHADPEKIELFDVLSAPGVLLVFGLAPATAAGALPPSVPTAETEGWYLIHEPAELAFPLHTAVAKAFFARRDAEHAGAAADGGAAWLR